MAERNTSGESDALWAMGCGVSVAVAPACAVLGTFVDALLVSRAHGYCLDESGTGEDFFDLTWMAGRLIVFPVVTGVSLLASFPIVLIAHRVRFADHGWWKAVMTAFAILVSITGPVATIVHDVATEGITGDCDPPWWPSWLPL
ncbi:hypothetical protein [Streptosporangium longisporum]|uniref:Integral membrane protein n=1 Tax=Streptosporangium longisporum TaxID=46187 RepID=A0ABP6KMU1_9ACTN